MCRKGCLLVLLMLGLCLAVDSVQAATVISNVAHRNTDGDAPELPQISNPLDNGELFFVDRTHIYAVLQEYLIGADYVMTANDNKNWSAYQLDITFSGSATLYVFIDNRMGGAAGGLDVAPNIDGMPWVTDMGFVDTGDDIGIDESADGSINQYLSVFALDVSAGTVTIGGCTEGNGGNMYGVAALPRTSDRVAHNAVPVDGATDVVREVVLSWDGGIYAQTRNVYLGANYDDVNTASTTNPKNVLASAGQTETTLDAGPLAFDQTYYWRVDEVNGAPDRTVYRGDVWSFTVEPKAVAITAITATASGANTNMGPEKTIDGSGLNALDEHSTEASDMWLTETAGSWIQYEFDKAYKLYELLVWNSNQPVEAFIGFGVKEATIETSIDGETWTALDGVATLARATGLPNYTANTAVAMGGVMAKFVKLSVVSSHGGLSQSGLAEVRFMAIPVAPRQPQPADGATTASAQVQLSWRSGREAASHQVYFGTDADNLTLFDTTSEASTTTDALDYGTTYTWSVTEVNDAAVPASHAGDLWTFTTPDFGTVDDFESYSGDEGKEVFLTWFDGFGGDATLGGSTTGHIDGPFVEKSIVHSGSQSMPVYIDNDGGFFDIDGKSSSPTFSEVVREFDSPQDWTASNVKSLSIMFAGSTGLTGQLYCKIGGKKMLYEGDAANLGSSAWQAWNIDLSKVGGNLKSVRDLAIGVEGGTSGILYIDDIRLYPRLGTMIVPVAPDNANLLAYYTFEGNANDSSDNGLNGTVNFGQISGPGKLGAGSALWVQQSGYADLGNPKALDFATGDWTLTAWYKTAMTGTGDANKGTIVAKGGDNGGGHRYALIMSETTAGVVTLVVDDDVTKVVLNSSSVTNNDQWHFVAGQRVGQEIRIYIDGQLEGTAALPAGYSLAGTSQHNAYIGAVTDHTNNVLYKLFNGFLDEVQIYGRALSAEEILYMSGKTKPVHQPF